jgi:hypothetical protein
MDPNTTNAQGSSGQPPSDPQDYSKPVAYDEQGRPLYARPPEQPSSGPPQTVYLSRPLEPVRQAIPEDIQRRAEESQKLYPQLNLSDGEYVIAAVRRHPIGLLQIWGTLFVAVVVFIGLYFMLTGTAGSSTLGTVFSDPEKVRTAGGVLVGGITFLLSLGGLVATYIYNGNRFYLTNESVIQEVQTSLFSKYEQTVSLSNVEDASYRQTNPIQMLLNYGSIRLSTQGDETTYRFSYVSHPKNHIAVLNNAVEAFKNGRPVHG